MKLTLKEVLGVTRDASRADIKKAYHKVFATYHHLHQIYD